MIKYYGSCEIRWANSRKRSKICESRLSRSSARCNSTQTTLLSEDKRAHDQDAEFTRLCAFMAHTDSSSQPKLDLCHNTSKLRNDNIKEFQTEAQQAQTDKQTNKQTNKQTVNTVLNTPHSGHTRAHHNIHHNKSRHTAWHCRPRS